MYFKAAFNLGKKYKGMSERKIIDRADFVIRDSGDRNIVPYLVALDKLHVVFGEEHNPSDFGVSYLSEGLGISLDKSGIKEISPLEYFEIIEKARERGLPVSSVPSWNNKLDVDTSDLTVSEMPIKKHDFWLRNTMPASLRKEIEKLESDDTPRTPIRNASRLCYYIVSREDCRRLSIRETLLKTISESKLILSSYYGEAELKGDTDESIRLSLDRLHRTSLAMGHACVVISIRDENVLEDRKNLHEYAEILSERKKSLTVIESPFYDEAMVKALCMKGLALTLIQDPGYSKADAKKTIEDRIIFNNPYTKNKSSYVDEWQEDYLSENAVYNLGRLENEDPFSDEVIPDYEGTIYGEERMNYHWPEDTLMSLPLLDRAKDFIKGIISYSALLEERKARGLKANHSPELVWLRKKSGNVERKLCTDIPSLSMLFIGDKGTGKETVARIFADMLSNRGILMKEKDGKNILFLKKAHFIAKGPMESASVIRETFNRALGGLVFIDWHEESLDEEKRDRDSLVLDNLISLMEKFSGKLCVILSIGRNVYRDISARCPGLLSSVPFSLHFPSYSDEELWTIFSYYLERKGLNVEEGVKEAVMERFGEMRMEADFAYGDSVMKLIQEGDMRLTRRIVSSPHSEEADVATFIPSDFSPSIDGQD